MPESLAERAVVRIAKIRHIGRFAVRALLRANELLGLALGVRLAKLRDSDDRLAGVFALLHKEAYSRDRQDERIWDFLERLAKVERGLNDTPTLAGFTRPRQLAEAAIDLSDQRPENRPQK